MNLKTQNISIKKGTKRLFFFSFLNFIVILIAVVLIYFSSYFYNRMEDQSRSVTYKVNHLIVLLNEQLNEDLEHNPSTEVMKAIDDITRDVHHLYYFLIKDREFPLPLYENRDELKAYYDEVALFVITLRKNTISFRTKTFQIIWAELILSALFSIFNMWEHVRWRKNNLRFMDDIRMGLVDIDHILRNQNPEMDYSSSIKESQHFFNYILEINRSIEFNKRIRDLSVFGSLDDIIEYVYSLVSVRMPCDRVALAFLNEDRNVIAETFYSAYNNVHLEQGFSLSLDKTSLGAVAASQSFRIINDLPEYYRSRRESISTELVLREGLRSSITIPMFFQSRCIGFVFFSSRELNAYNEEQATYAKRIIDLLKQKLYIEYILQNVIADTSQSFVTLMNKKDNETAQHISRMSRYSYIIAKKYSELYDRQTPKFIREIFWYSPLHDIGKVGIPDNILLKEGSLTREEMDVMKGHVTIGEKVIEEINRRMSRSFSIPALNTAVEIISGHHEKYDGTGYPRGLRGEEIPLAGRIVSMADVFDALTSHRPYKEAFSIEQALDIIEKSMLEQFDPKVYSCFIESLKEIKVIYDQYRDS